MLWRVSICSLVALLLVLSLAAVAQAPSQPLVAVVYGSYSYASDPQGEGYGAVTYRDTVTAALDQTGIDYAVLDDAAVEADGLLPYPTAIFPYNFVVPDTEQDAIERYLAAGGKIVVCYALPSRVAGLIGVSIVGWAPGNFTTLQLDQALLPGAPASVYQGSWNILRFAPANAETLVAGTWLGPDGESLGEPGLSLSPTGAFIGHVLTGADLANKGRMLVSVLAKLSPGLAPLASAQALESAAARVDEITAQVYANHSGTLAQAQPYLDAAQAALVQAQSLASEGRDAEAVSAAMEAPQQAELAYAASATERSFEFRGVWLNDSYAAVGGGWEPTIGDLRDRGFNAILPLLVTGGLAYYPSALIPVDARVTTEGDQVAAALQWCKSSSVQLHLWKINYELFGAPAAFVDQMRAEGRLQRRCDGTEVLALCPSDPRNFALERDVMLELVRNYDLAGIHFDYIRYDNCGSCYCEGCRQRFEQATGVPVAIWPDDVRSGARQGEYRQWRRDQVTALVRAVSSEARALRPGVQISAAVWSWPWALDVGQDWPQWVQEGLLDFVCPMEYTADAADLEARVAQDVTLVNGRIPLYLGIGSYLIGGSYDLVDQLERARRLGADGFSLFSYDTLAGGEGRLDALHLALTAHATPTPHPAPRVSFLFPEPGYTYVAGAPLPITVALTREANYASPVRRAAGYLRVESTDGRVLRRLRLLGSGRSPVTVDLAALPPGSYRLSVRGQVLLANGSRPRFVVRSRPFEVIPPSG